MALTSTSTASASAAASRARTTTRGQPRSILFKPRSSESGVQKKTTTTTTHSGTMSAAPNSKKHATPLATRDITAPTPLDPTPVPTALPATPAVTDFQRRVYDALLQIPQGKVATYAGLATALGSAPRAVGGALRRNPWAPEVPCHRVVKNDGYIGGFMGDMHAAPSGVNCQRKLQLLAGEGVFFDAKGFIKDRAQVWDGFKAV